MQYKLVSEMILRVFLIPDLPSMVTAVIMPARSFSLVHISLRKTIISSLERNADDDENDGDKTVQTNV